MSGLATRPFVCYAPDTVVPATSGSAARTLGLARAVRPAFASVSLRCFSPEPTPAAPDGLDVQHFVKPQRGLGRARQVAAMFLSPALGFRFPGPLDDGDAVVQLASPLLFEAARRRGLGRFILDAHNIYQDMADFPQARLGERAFYRLTRRRQARMELACWAAAQHVLFCSAVDRDRAERLLPGIAARSTVVPNCVDAAAFTPRPPAAFATGGPVLFMGTARYPPNHFAVDEICRQIAPALPELSFWVVGDPAGAPRRVPGNVRLLGRVPSTAPALAAAQIGVAPVRHGSGTRLKLLEYFAAGLPVVCTAKAAEGLDVRDGRDVVIAETPADFVAALRALHGDAARAAALGTAARALVRARYDWRAVLPALLAVYEAAAA